MGDEQRLRARTPTSLTRNLRQVSIMHNLPYNIRFNIYTAAFLLAVLALTVLI